MTGMRAQIEIQAPHRGSIKLDGFDVARGVKGFKLVHSAHPASVPQLYLELVIIGGAEVDTDVEVRLPDETVELLKLLGWTPPA